MLGDMFTFLFTNSCINSITINFPPTFRTFLLKHPQPIIILETMTPPIFVQFIAKRTQCNDPYVLLDRNYGGKYLLWIESWVRQNSRRNTLIIFWLNIKRVINVLGVFVSVLLFIPHRNDLSGQFPIFLFHLTNLQCRFSR